MGLSTKIINLSRLDLSEDINKIGTIAEITIVQLEFAGVYELNVNDTDLDGSPCGYVRSC